MRWLLILLFAFSLMASELHLAVKKLDEKQITALLDDGIDINAIDQKGETALHSAARIGRLKMVELLLKYEPDLYIESDQGYTPLAIAIHHNHVKSILALVKAQQDDEYKWLLPQLHKSVIESDIKGVQALLDEGVPVDMLDHQGATSLQLAAKEGSLEMVKLLIASGADVLYVDREGKDVLYAAKYGKNKAVIDLILEEKKKRGRK